MGIKAIALVGFYRGELVEPGTVLDLPPAEFGELRTFNLVDYAPAVQAPPPPAPEKPAAKAKTTE